MKSCVDQYTKVLHVLLYLANSKQPKTIREIADNVVDINIGNIRKMMQQLVTAGYVINYAPTQGTKHRYAASDQTIELYATDRTPMPTPKTRYIDRGLGSEKLCNKCNQYFPNTDEYFYRLPPSRITNRYNTLDNICIHCYRMRSAMYRAKKKEINHA